MMFADYGYMLIDVIGGSTEHVVQPSDRHDMFVRPRLHPVLLEMDKPFTS